jgi:hypothetical protein
MRLGATMLDSFGFPMERFESDLKEKGCANIAADDGFRRLGLRGGRRGGLKNPI